MNDNIEAVETACTELANQGEPITFTVISELTGISRTTLYRNQQLRAIVDEHRSQTTLFPDGSATLDNALMVRGIRHTWHTRAPLASGPTS